MAHLTLVTPASAVSLLTEARIHLRLGDDTGHDDRILAMLDGLVDDVEADTGRQLLTATWDYVLDGFPWKIELPKPPVQSVTSITYTDEAGDSQTVSSSTYVVTKPGGVTGQRATISLASGQSWPTVLDQPDVVTVRFVSGYGASAVSLPKAIRLALFFGLEDLFDEPTVPVRAQGFRSDASVVMGRLLAKFRTRPTIRVGYW